MAEIRETVLAQMSSVFGTAAADIPEGAAPGVIGQWDSLRHMMLIVALEEAFHIRFADHELTSLIGVPQIVEVVSRKVAR